MYKINDNCVGCHNCFSECPVQAIEWVGTKYEIDPDICVSCGLCAKVCHTQSIYDTDAPDDVIYHDPVTMHADVVVAGCGSGLVAAVKAAQAGKKVICLEKAKVLGGNTDYAHGFFPVYSKWHEEAGMPDAREEAIEHFDKETDGILGKDVLRTAVYGTGEFFDWLCTLDDVHKYFRLVDLGSVDAHGPIYGSGLIEFKQRIKDNLNCRDDAIGPGWGGTYVKYTMLKTIKEQGLDVTILTEHAAKHLILDEKGAIAGVTAEDPGGTTTIYAPVVILATGGFGKSDEKIKEFKPWFFEGETKIHRFSVPTDTGDGIDMLRELGVEPVKSRLFVSMFGPKHHPFSNTLADIALEPEMLQVNLDGKRWVNEEGHLFGMTPLISKQPKEISYSIQSLDNIRMIAERFINNPAFASKKYLYETWYEELEDESRLDTPVKKGETIEELEKACGMPEGSLTETIRRYNEDCQKGADSEFGKGKAHMVPVSDKGPYYAIYGQRFSEASMGGLMVDGQCRVLRNDNTPIPGLYGVGDATSAMHRENALAVISELTWAVCSSYVSGRNAVNYIAEKEVD